MKKIICILIAIVMLLTLAGCNMGLGLGSFEFTHIHICDFSGSSSHAKIEKWYDGESGIEVNTKEYGSLFLSEGTYILYNDECPICDKNN